MTLFPDTHLRAFCCHPHLFLFFPAESIEKLYLTRATQNELKAEHWSANACISWLALSCLQVYSAAIITRHLSLLLCQCAQLCLLLQILCYEAYKKTIPSYTSHGLFIPMPAGKQYRSIHCLFSSSSAQHCHKELITNSFFFCVSHKRNKACISLHNPASTLLFVYNDE